MPNRVAVLSKALNRAWASSMYQLNGVQEVEVKMPNNIVYLEDINTRDATIVRRDNFDDIEVSIKGIFDPSRGMTQLLRGILNYSSTTNPDTGVRYRHLYNTYGVDSSIQVLQIYIDNTYSPIAIDQAVVKSIKIDIAGTDLARYTVDAIGKYVSDVSVIYNTETIKPIYRVNGTNNVFKASISLDAKHRPVYSVNGDTKIIGFGNYDISVELESNDAIHFTRSRDNTSTTLNLNLYGDTLGTGNYGLEFSLLNAYAVSVLPVKAGEHILLKAKYIGNLGTFAVHNGNSNV
ncbi:MAG: hypothetical protein QW416_07880 [Candidatus Nitrosocaldaceae archaeon]